MGLNEHSFGGIDGRWSEFRVASPSSRFDIFEVLWSREKSVESLSPELR